MNVLITGGSGFIGSHIVNRLLADKHTVLNLDCHTYAAAHGSRQTMLEGRSDYRLELADIGEKIQVAPQVAEFQPEWIIHAAAETHVDRAIDDPHRFVGTNIHGTYNLLEAARQLPGLQKFCYVSTDEVYVPWSLNEDGSGPIDGFTEAHPLNPRNPYAATKAAAEHLCMSYFYTYDLPVVITRGSNTYGPYQLPEKFLPMMIMRAAQSKPLPIYGDGAQTREWLHVKDHVAGILKACEAGRPGERYNLGPGTSECNLHIALAILERMGKPQELIEHVQDRPGHDRDYAICNRKAEQELQWDREEEFIKMTGALLLDEDGLTKTLDWYLGTGYTWAGSAALAGNLERKGLR